MSFEHRLGTKGLDILHGWCRQWNNYTNNMLQPGHNQNNCFGNIIAYRLFFIPFFPIFHFFSIKYLHTPTPSLFPPFSSYKHHLLLPVTTKLKFKSTSTKWPLEHILNRYKGENDFLKVIELAKIANIVPTPNAWPERGDFAVKRRRTMKNDLLNAKLFLMSIVRNQRTWSNE